MVASQSVLMFNQSNLVRCIKSVPADFHWRPVNLCALWYLLPMMPLNIRPRNLYVLGWGFLVLSFCFVLVKLFRGACKIVS